MTRDKREVMLCHRETIVRQTPVHGISHLVKRWGSRLYKSGTSVV
jgi:hypothetical protein